MYDFYDLPLPRSGAIEQILHLSDIHIRAGQPDKCRYKEYNTVFKNTVNSFKNIPSVIDGSAVIIITGDIFDNKMRVDSPGIKLFGSFIKNLSLLAPTYLFAGNHDVCIQYADCPDLISVLTKLADLDNLYYMNKSGYYLAGNVGFGLVSVNDTMKRGTTSGELLETLPTFPKAKHFPDNITTKIALYHGTIISCTLQNGYSSKDGINLGYFAGYDCAILGDIHLQQIVNADKNADYVYKYGDSYNIDNCSYDISEKLITYGYSGSLLQKNFGETLFGHGYLLWDFTKKNIQKYHVYNPSGYVQVCYEKAWLIKVRNTWLPLYETLEASDIDYVPEILYLRILNCDASNKHLNDLYDYLDEKNIVYHKNFYNNTVKIKNKCINKQETNASYNKPEAWIDNFTSYIDAESFADYAWQTWLKAPENLCLEKMDIPDESIHSYCDQRNKSIKSKILTYKESIEVYDNLHSTFKLLYIDWDWLLCYGEDNYYNFENSHPISMLNANNGHGKSSFLEIIHLSLFGCSIPTRNNKANNASIICQQIPKNTKANTSLIFTVNDDKYNIVRTYSYRDKGTDGSRKGLTTQVELYIFDEEIDDFIEEAIASGSNTVNEWIKGNVCDSATFLRSCMLTQGNDENFLVKKTTEQKSILDDCFNLESTKHFRNIINEVINANDYVKDKVHTLYVQTEEECRKIPEQTEHETYAKLCDNCADNISLLKDKRQKIANVWANYDADILSLDDETITNKIMKLQKKLDKYADVGNTNAKELEYDKRTLREQIIDILDDDICIAADYQKINDDIANVQRLKPPKPEMDITHVDNEYERLNKWKNKHAKYVNFSKTEVDDIEVKQSKEILLKAKNTLDNARKKLSKAENVLIQHVKGHNKPHYEKEYCDNWLKDFEIEDAKYVNNKNLLIDICADIDRYEKQCKDIVDIEMEISDTQKKIQKITDYDHPFNPECESCNKQLWKIELNELHDKKEVLERLLIENVLLLSTIKVSFNIDLAIEKREILMQKLSKHEKCLEVLDCMKNAQKENIEYLTYLNKNKLYDEAVTMAKNYYETRLTNFEILEKSHDKLVKEYEEFLIYKAYASEKLYYLELEKQLLRNRKLHQDYDNYNKSIYNLENLKNNKLLLDISKVLDRYYLYTEIVEKLRYWTDLQNIVPAYRKYKKYSDKIEQEENILIDAKLKLNEINTLIKMYQKKNALNNCRATFIENVTHKQKILNQLHELFDNYISDFYKNIGIPNLLNEVNRYIELVCDTDDLKLDAEFDSNDNYNWIIIDGINKPSIEKASGFQRFIISLSIRVALSYLGGNTVKCNQLFIDEGFSCFDAYHLGKVPELMDNLLSIYDSIIMVSHLDEIKTCGYPISIIREASLSKIQFGERY